MSRLVAWGAGELGGRVARAWAASGRPVLAITRTAARHGDLAAAGVGCAVSSDPPPLEPGDRLLLALPGTAAQRAAVDALSAAGAARTPVRAVLASSTAYYGLAGGTLDESTPAGETEGARAVRDGEALFTDAMGPRGVIVRLGGLYRPGRGPYAALARTSCPPDGPPNKALALIHYDDAARAILMALEHAAPEAVYLAVTPPLPTRRDYYEAACARLGLPLPAFAPPLPGHPADHDVALLRRDLLGNPTHTDWRDALA